MFRAIFQRLKNFRPMLFPPVQDAQGAPFPMEWATPAQQGPSLPHGFSDRTPPKTPKKARVDDYRRHSAAIYHIPSTSEAQGARANDVNHEVLRKTLERIDHLNPVPDAQSAAPIARKARDIDPWTLIFGDETAQENALSEQQVINDATRDLHHFGLRDETWFALCGEMQRAFRRLQSPETRFDVAKYAKTCTQKVLAGIEQIAANKPMGAYSGLAKSKARQIERFRRYFAAQLGAMPPLKRSCHRKLEWRERQSMRLLPIEPPQAKRARTLEYLANHLLCNLLTMDQGAFERRLPLVKLFMFFATTLN